jgi:hypothetical protein
MRRHYTNYFKGLANIKEYRARLVTEDNPQNLFGILAQIEADYTMEASFAFAS